MRPTWANWSLRTQALTVLAVPVVPLMVSAALVILSARREQAAEQWVRHTLEIKAQIETNIVMAVEADASVEDFLLTGKRDALRPFMEIGAQWPAALTHLVELVRDNPSQVQRLTAIAALSGKNPLVTLVTYATAHPGEPVPPDMLAANQEVVSTFRRELSAMQNVEDTLLTERIEAADRARRRVEMATLGGVLMGVIGSVAGAVIFWTGISHRLGLVRQNAALLARGEDLLPTGPDRADEVGVLVRDLYNTDVLLKARDAELRNHAAELRAVNQELEAFSYSVSHDLRAPLRHITGFAALLEASTTSSIAEEDRRRLDTIVAAANRMGRLIDDLLAFSRVGRSAFARGRVRLDDVVREARREATLDGDRPVTWTVHPLPDVEGDAAMLRLAFVNLIGNALKYTRQRQDPAIEIGAMHQDAAESVIYVRDNGVGFDMKYADKLFGVFQRLHSSDQFEGTGIGLANVRRIVNRHGGRTWAEGAVNQGATFFISLPARASGQARASAA